MTSKRNRNIAKLPQTPLAFYIKLYCDRKSATKCRYKNNLIEATKSYLSLTESEKQKFAKKLEECKDKNKSRFFEQLKSAKPYLKVKKVSLENIDSTINNTDNRGSEEELSNCSYKRRLSVTPPLETNCKINISNQRINSEEPTINELEQDQNILEADPENDELQSQSLIEPIPPSIKTGHQLFYLLNAPEEGGNVSWTSLPQFEKNRYSRAVSLLKKDYISKYKEYLESLSSKELFEHYYKTVI
ncbi:unnamed protein product [Arctia plantaginis]|uniref:Uncharacterized protein n=1 Tax=Arctia plantaginis TaxID=874455 RepID=A0A8S1A5G7_ARCPL|nr:unnamed protein product [Arctia plantaginis]CAB3240581.1 unnamed protein product [Arctia plantaginis]